ncbi:MAG: hypothetical protein OXF04_09240 [bacterium]|nr:hypothetical protein [bacterium]
MEIPQMHLPPAQQSASKARKARWQAALAALVVVLMVAAGCSDDEPESSPAPAAEITATPAAATPTAAPTPEPAPESEPLAASAPEVTGRLLVADGEGAMMSVVDVGTGAVAQDAFDLGSRPTRVYATKSGRFAIAVATDANDAHVFDGGVYLEPHDDHMDLVKRDVSRLEIDLSGDRPIHLNVGKDWAGLFYDGSGNVAFIAEEGLAEEGGSYMPALINVGAHHGALVSLDNDLFAVSYRHPDYESDPQRYVLPIGAEIVNADGESLHRQLDCEGLHGNAGNGSVAVFGCIGGAMFIEVHDDATFHSGFVSAPEGAAEDFRLGSVWGAPGLDHFLALGGAVGLWVVNPHDGAMELLIPAVEGRSAVDVNFSHDGKSFLVLMGNGELRKYDAERLTLLAATSDFLSGPVAPDFYGRPSMVTAPGAVFVTDPTGEQVLMLEDEDLNVVQSWNVDGIPTKLAFVGILG